MDAPTNTESEFTSITERAKTKLRRDMGALVTDALEDPLTVELMCNANGQLWQEKLGQKMQRIGYLRTAQAEAIIRTVAAFHNKEVTRFNPIVEGELPFGNARFAGQLPPVVSGPTFAIRKTALVIHTLDDYQAAEIITPERCEVLRSAIRAHRNILVTGGTGSGKTTLVNAIIMEMVLSHPDERIVILEDTGEIQCAASNAVQYHTTLDVTLTTLLKISLRMRPDRILVGEVRGPEALDLLDAWNTGHEGGAATLHANGALAGLSRLKSLVTRNTAAPAHIEPLIAEAVHLVVHIARAPGGRRVEEILEVSGYENGHYLTQHM